MPQATAIEVSEQRRNRARERSRLNHARVSETTGRGVNSSQDAPAIQNSSVSILGDARFAGRGNMPARIALLQDMQQTQGNRAVQRFLHSRRPDPASHLSLQKCGDHPCSCGSCGPDREKDEARATPVQRIGPLPPLALLQQPAPKKVAVTPWSIMAGMTVFDKIAKVVELGKGAELNVPIFGGLVQVPYVGPVEIGLDAEGTLQPSLVAKLGPGRLRIVSSQMITPDTSDGSSSSSPSWGAQLGTKAGSAVGEWVKDATGSEFAGKLAGGYAGGVAGGLVFNPWGGSEAGYHAGGGKPTITGGDTIVRGTAKLTVPAEVTGKLKATAKVLAEVNPILFPFKFKAEAGLAGSLGASADNKENPQVADVEFEMQNGKLKFSSEMNIAMGLRLAADLSAFAEARFKAGYGAYSDEKPAKGDKQSSQVAAPGIKTCKRPGTQPSGGGEQKEDDDDWGYEAVWKRKWSLAGGEWPLWQTNVKLSTRSDEDMVSNAIEPEGKDTIDLTSVVSEIAKHSEPEPEPSKAPGQTEAAGAGAAGESESCVPEGMRPAEGDIIIRKLVKDMRTGKKGRYRARITEMPEGDPSDPTKYVHYVIEKGGKLTPDSTKLSFFLADFNGEHRLFEPFDAAVLKEDLKNKGYLDHWLLKPGPFAKESIDATTSSANTTQKALIQPIGARHGCHHCGKMDCPHFIADHIPPTGLVEHGLMDGPQVLYPQCDKHRSEQSNIVKEIIGIWTGKSHIEDD